ncbi:hypothetical protein DTL42_05435 [Bremerella cremea]|uniref:Uncharacterized protein n=1 Tax=Bremerella cremea TaxID=1031537 RepID=A0A368KVX4_9BACT|nr:hypothetical protein [Bremerella cremea]RCS54580.1 hypothetical protein DTL42_05435 [Bremerella cremea]
MDEREELLNEALEENAVESMDELVERFGPESYGNHEAVDRIYLAESNWSQHVSSHPSILLDAAAFEKALKISELMAELYQHMSEKE